MTGKLYGVGVGPGDPELITLKALRLTKEADILAFPGEKPIESVAYRIMGDPTVYSTYIYVHKRVEQLGYATEIVSGITSFCAVSARFNEGLVEKSQQLHVIPASYQIEEALKLPGTKVLMKTGKKMQEVKAQIKASGNKAEMIENCGMPDEKIYRSVEEIPDDAGYSLIIVKEK